MLKSTVSRLASALVVSKRGRRVAMGGVALLLSLAAAIHMVTGAEEPAPPSSEGNGYIAIARGRIDIEGGIVQLAARRDGVIKEVAVEEGDRVKKGAVLAVLDDQQARLGMDLARKEVAQAQAALGQLQVRLRAAEREEARYARLVQNDAVARAESERAQDQTALIRSEIEVAHAAVAAAKARESLAAFEIEQRVVRAPASGIIVRRQARPGDGVSTVNVTPLFWFAPDGPRIVRAELEERFIGAVKVGTEAEVVFEGEPPQTLPARVLRLGLLFGPKRPVTDDPYERSDSRVIECVIALPGEHMALVFGRRVLVKFKNT